MATKYVKIEAGEKLMHALLMKGDTSTIEIAIVSKRETDFTYMYQYRYVMLIDDNDEFGKDNTIAGEWATNYGDVLAGAEKIAQSNVAFTLV